MSTHQDTSMNRSMTSSMHLLTAIAAGTTMLCGTASAHDYQPGVDPQDKEEHTASFGFDLSPGDLFFSVPAFDDQGGARVLDSVLIRLDAEIGAAISAENTGAEPILDWHLEHAGWLAMEYAGGESLFESYRDTLAAGDFIAADDGTPGSGDDFHDFGYLGKQIILSRQHDSEDAAEIFQGDGVVSIVVLANAGFGIVPGTPDIEYTLADFGVSGVVKVTYGFHTRGSGEPCPGDADSSGWVEFDDLLTVFAFWGQCPEDTACTGDLDESGDVGFTDLLAVLSNWGVCPD